MAAESDWLFVGLFIEQVEAAMQGLGGRLGDALAVVFPKRVAPEGDS